MNTEVNPTNAILYSRFDAARSLGVCVRTIDNMAEDGRLLTVRIGRRVLISRRQLEALAGGNTSVGAPMQSAGIDVGI